MTHRIVLSSSTCHVFPNGTTITARDIHTDDLGRLKATISADNETKVLYSDEPRFFSNVGFIHLHDIRVRPIRVGTTGGGNQAVLIVE